MRAGMEDYRAMEMSLGVPYQQALYAQLCREAGLAEEALGVVTSALAASGRADERFWDPELLRTKGELLLERGALREARAAVEQALETAREQSAR